jgi:signal transduction histidine kinase
LYRDPIVAPLAVSAVAATAVVLLWLGLRADHESKVAQVTEAASYATRSELAQQLIQQFRAFRELADFWSSNQRGQGVVDSAIPLVLFEGVDLIAWNEQGGARFLTDGSELAFDREPSDAEWAPLQQLLPAERPTRTTISGPVIDADGHAIFSLIMPVSGANQQASLVGLIDAHDALSGFLADEAPGYDIRVTCCEGVELYNRGTPEARMPETWTRSGWIEPEPGMLWNVSHRPSPGLAADLTPWATNAVLFVGLAMSFLLGALVYQTKLAKNRAAAASAAEHSVRMLNRNLEDQVALRTKDLHEVLADLNTINLSVSHDLRSPLNAISLLSHRLRLQEGQPEGSKERFDRIAANVKQMANILDRLFGFSRASSFEYSIQDVDMRAIAKQVVHDQSAGDERGPQVEIGDLPHADADETMVHILLTNLVSNALKYSNGSRIQIGHRSQDGQSVYFVRDFGPGFDSALSEDLFKPLRRFSGNNKSEGLGLGLTIAARIAQRHGGRIWAEGKIGKGATFFFTLAEAQRPDPEF